MTESEWLTSTDPAAMLEHLTHDLVHAAGVGTTRVARKPALISDRKLRLVCHAVLTACGKGPFAEDYQPTGTSSAATWASRCLGPFVNGSLLSQHPELNRPALLLEIRGNPFWALSWVRKEDADWVYDIAPGINPAWLSPDALGLARTIYNEQAFDQLPILADALSDAGCTSPILMNHCRGLEPCPSHDTVNVCDLCKDTGWMPLRGPHVRGCWAVDLLLGKE